MNAPDRHNGQRDFVRPSVCVLMEFDTNNVQTCLSYSHLLSGTV